MVVLAGVVALLCSIWIAVIAFRHGILWGLACLIIPLVSLLFAITHWSETKLPLVIGLIATGVYVAGR